MEWREPSATFTNMGWNTGEGPEALVLLGSLRRNCSHLTGFPGVSLQPPSKMLVVQRAIPAFPMSTKKIRSDTRESSRVREIPLALITNVAI